MNPQMFLQLYTQLAGGQWSPPVNLGPYLDPYQGQAVLAALAALAPQLATPLYVQGWQALAGQAWQTLGGGFLGGGNVKMSEGKAAAQKLLQKIKTGEVVLTAAQKKALVKKIVATPQGKKLLAAAFLQSLVKKG